jgi:hypothetical protein
MPARLKRLPQLISSDRPGGYRKARISARRAGLDGVASMPRAPFAGTVSQLPGHRRYASRAPLVARRVGTDEISRRYRRRLMPLQEAGRLVYFAFAYGFKKRRTNAID